MRQVWIPRFGKPEVLELRNTADPEPKPGEVRIRVRAAGINFADIMARMGLYPDTPPLPAVVGYEVAGDVDAVGAGVVDRALGERVFALTHFGGYSDDVCVRAESCMTIPTRMTYEEAAAVPMNYLTAYLVLFHMGALKAGERVLIHSAAGGVGLAAVDLCAIAGAEAIGTASAAKHAMLRERGVVHVIDYTKRDYESEVKRITGGRGVHLVLEAMGGDHWAKGFRCLGPTGRLVILGMFAAATGKSRSVGTILGMIRPMLKSAITFHPMRLVSENKAVIGAAIGRLFDETELLRGWLGRIVEWYEAGRIHPTVGATFPLAEAARAHHYIQDRKSVGKVVLVP